MHCVLAVLLLTLPVLTVWGASATARSPSPLFPLTEGDSETFSLRESDTETALPDTEAESLAPESEKNTFSEESQPDETLPAETLPAEDLYDPDLPVTQELIARRVVASMSDADREARGGTTIRYPYPSGAMAVELYKDGSRILKGQVADIGGTNNVANLALFRKCAIWSRSKNWTPLSRTS